MEMMENFELKRNQNEIMNFKTKCNWFYVSTAVYYIVHILINMIEIPTETTTKTTTNRYLPITQCHISQFLIQNSHFAMMGQGFH